MQKKIRQWDGFAGISLVLIVFLSAYSLELTFWTYNLNRVTILALLGLIIGLSIGLSTFSEKISRLLSWLYGISILFLQLVISLDNAPLWLDRVNNYILRFRTSTDQLIRNIPLEDGILFLTLAGIMFCFISINLGFKFLRQKNSWVSFALIVFFYYLIQFYLPTTQRNYFFISIFTLLVVIYLGRQHYLTRKKAWDLKGIKSDKEISAYFSKFVLIFTLILVLFSLGIPQVISKISENKSGASSFQKTREYSTSWGALRNFFYPLRQQAGFGEGYLPEILALGNSRSLKDDEAFIVKAPDEIIYPNRYYWKGRSYDYYENGLWQSKETEIEHYSSIVILPFSAQSTSTGIFSFIYKYPREIIFTPQIVFSINREADLMYFPISDESQDVQSIIDNQLVRQDEQIDVLGAFYNPDWKTLLNSSESIPEWVESRYLQLPADFSEKITLLAFDLTSGEDTRIEKALSITNYLRKTFRYKDSIEIPQGEDPIEWFLFEGREGFCNYFSTANVLMLRSIGIPARMVVGYAQGERFSDNEEFLVSIKDSHSWVEAFFPESGWIILEPTPSQPGVILETRNIVSEDFGREETLTLENAGQEQDPGTELFSRVNEKYEINDPVNQSKVSLKNGFILAVLVLFLSVCLILIIIHHFFFRKGQIKIPIILDNRNNKNGKTSPVWLRHWAEYERLPLYQRAYKKIQLLCGFLLFKVDKNLTPNEFLEELIKNFDADEKSVRLFLEQYHELTYGGLKDNPSEPYFENYEKIIRLIIKRWKAKRIEEIILRIRPLEIK